MNNSSTIDDAIQRDQQSTATEIVTDPTTTTTVPAHDVDSTVEPDSATNTESINPPSDLLSRTQATVEKLATTSTRSWLDKINTKCAVLTGPSTFLGSSSNISLLLQQPENGATHYALPDEVSVSSSRINELNNEEIEILKFRGAFLLPPRDLCDEIIESFFEKIHPTVPYLSRSKFMRQYNDPLNPPSLLLLQSMLLAGSRVCRSPALLDATGSADLASITFYKRAKALFDANYELDRMTIVQSIMLLGWWWAGPEDVTKNSFYWARVSLSVAQGFGLHRSMENTDMPLVNKRIWKRTWWSLFMRDRWVAVSLGRPLVINLEDSDVPMLEEDDFNEDEPGFPSTYPINRVNMLYFIHAVKLSEIVGLVLKQQFSVNAEKSRRQKKVPVVSHCDMAMASWMNSLPPELKYSVKDRSNHNYFTSLLHAQYYTVLCLVHRSNILRKGTPIATNSYPSWGIAFQAAHMISRIFENLLYFEECRECGATYVYSLFSAMIMLLYQTDSPHKSVVESAKRSLVVCSQALEEMGHTWITARMILSLFEKLTDNKMLRTQFMNEARKRPYDTAFLKNYPIKRMKSSEKNARAVGWAYDAETKFGTSAKTTPKDGTTEMKESQKKERKLWEQAIASVSRPQVNISGADSDRSSPSYDPPDFSLVTNTSTPSHQFYNNFEPSQLFPEVSMGGAGGTEVDFFSNNLFMDLDAGVYSNSNVAGSGSGTEPIQSDQSGSPETESSTGGGGGTNLKEGNEEWTQKIGTQFQGHSNLEYGGLMPDILRMETTPDQTNN